MNAVPFVSSLSGLPLRTGSGFVLSTTTEIDSVFVFPAVSVAEIVNVCVPSLRADAA